MRRSEAISLIINCLRECHDKSYLEEAEDILASLEQAGLTPPKIWIADPGHFPGDTFRYSLREWETEPSADLTELEMLSLQDSYVECSCCKCGETKK
jgi:hypothetical protein